VGFDSGLQKSSLLNIKKEERQKLIDNQSLMEPLHKLRLKDVAYGTDFLILPRFMFFPLSRWYQCNSVIERKVIHYKTSKN
jgi:hypothetical protein